MWSRFVAEKSAIRLLLVDDDSQALALLRNYLESPERDLVTAADGNEALQVVRDSPPQLVITDWSMPGMDGGQLCRAIRQLDFLPFVYLILVTADTEQERLLEAFDAGADDYVRKPFQRKELLARVRAGERIVRMQEELALHAREALRSNAEMAIGQERLQEAVDQLNVIATTDVLTGLTNRREAMTRLTDYWSLSVRQSQPLTCIVIDVDHFKNFNDVYGHEIGDQVLRHVALRLRESVRQGEFLARMGGEEFLIACPGSTERTATVAAERFRRAVEEARFPCGGHLLSMTISLGIAERTPEMRSVEHLLRAADTALYAAKDAGRNTFRSARSLPFSGHSHPEHPDEAGGETALLVRAPEIVARVLVVDSDPGVRAFCTRLLEREGYEVVEAATGSEALARVSQERPDAVVVDVSLPGMDGMECVSRLKSQPEFRDVPIIMTFSRTDGVDVARIIEAGADDFVVKPFQAQEFMLRIRNMVRFARELIRSNSVRGEQTRALELFLTFSRDIAAAGSLTEILDTTLVTAAALLCSRRVSILLPDSDREHLHIARHIGLRSEFAGSLRVPIGSWTTGSVFAARLGVVLMGTSSEPAAEFPDYELFSGTPGLCTPLVSPEGIVGVLTISGRHDAMHVGALESEYVDLICNIAASAIQDCLSRKARDEARDSIVVTLARLAESRDIDTGKHLDRVTRYCLLLAEHLRRTDRHRDIITDEFLNNLKRAVPLHDIGKVAIPDHILQKPGRLTPEEMNTMRTHAEIGARTIRSMIDRAPGARFLEMAEQIAFGHHEWFDGSGYPLGLRGDRIPLAARIAALADVYDALTTQRVYKGSMTHRQALATILASSGRQFDPDVVDAFQATADRFAELIEELADDPPDVGSKENPAVADSRPAKGAARPAARPSPAAVS
jgi:diguanylate cyclase (GGDEF)-like protein